MNTGLKKTFAALLLGSGILLTASGAFAYRHHHHHRYYRYQYYDRPHYNGNWYGQRRYAPQYRHSYRGYSRGYGPYAGYQRRYRHHHDD